MEFRRVSTLVGVSVAVLCIIAGSEGVAIAYHDYQESQRCAEAIHMAGYEVEQPSKTVVVYEDLPADRQSIVRYAVANGDVQLFEDARRNYQFFVEHSIRYEGSYYQFGPVAVECGEALPLILGVGIGSVIAVVAGGVLGARTLRPRRRA